VAVKMNGDRYEYDKDETSIAEVPCMIAQFEMELNHTENSW